jgi:hypothetical protein
MADPAPAPSIHRPAGCRREAFADAQLSEQIFARDDPADNASTHLPAGEQARIPVIWLAELFTPTTLLSLIGGVRELTSRQTGLRPRADDDPVEWITSTRCLAPA